MTLLFPTIPHFLDLLAKSDTDFAFFYDMHSAKPQLMYAADGPEYSESFVVAPFAPGKDTLRFRGPRFCGEAVEGALRTLLSEEQPRAVFSDKDNDARLQEENAASRARYFHDFARFHAALSEGLLHKLVLTRPELIRRKHSLTEFFSTLAASYPHAFRFFVKIRDVILVGATPELLCDIEKSRLSVMALAGTMPKSDKANYVWSGKNLLEQQIVTDFIADRITRITQQLRLTGPDTHCAGPVVHLLTLIQGELKEGVTNEQVIDLLHPTPAVCGLPQKAAMDFILSQESYSREYYCGYLGLISPEHTRLFVNLRSAQIRGDVACCYGGGGLLVQSQAEDEWLETERKISTLREML